MLLENLGKGIYEIMSGHCHNEHDHPGHSHAHNDAHDHSDDITPALQYSLYQHINFDDITTLNEAEANSGKAIIKKTWEERLDDQPELQSDADEQLLVHVP
jgi:hypothetical protein